MTVCYLIQTYKNPDQIYRLAKLIEETTSNSLIIISHNFNACSLNLDLFKKIKNLEIIPNNGVMMGSFGIIQGFFDAIDWLLRKKIKFDWLVNISGQDYPTQPLYMVENFLEKTKYDAFIEYFDAFSKQSPWKKRTVSSRYLYNYKHFQNYLSPWQRFMLKPIKHVVNNCQPLIRLDSCYGVTVGLKSFNNLFNSNFICYGGSYFATMSHKCVSYIYEFIQENPRIINYYRKTFIPEESLIQTILVNSNEFNLCNRNYRYMDFSNSRHGHPRVLTDRDFSILTKDDIHFARKFDMKVDSEILDQLDRRIFSYESQNVSTTKFVHKPKNDFMESATLLN